MYGYMPRWLRPLANGRASSIIVWILQVVAGRDSCIGDDLRTSTISSRSMMSTGTWWEMKFCSSYPSGFRSLSGHMMEWGAMAERNSSLCSEAAMPRILRENAPKRCREGMQRGPPS